MPFTRGWQRASSHGQHGFDEFHRFGARNQRAFIALENAAEEIGIADDILDRFAIDDALASLPDALRGPRFRRMEGRRIVELRPAFVKLDRSLIAGIESDDARQAMVVGLCHFASVTGCRLIVEGIETDSELSVLRDLALELGQGYLLGRPLPADA